MAEDRDAISREVGLYLTAIHALFEFPQYITIIVRDCRPGTHPALIMSDDPDKKFLAEVLGDLKSEEASLVSKVPNG